MKLFTNNPQDALPYQYYYIPILILTLAGIGDTIYLALSHYWNYTNISYASFCAISQAINCDTVSQSPWSIFGGIPLAFWGLIGYLLFLLFLIPARHNSERTRPLWSMLFILAGLFTLSAIFFGYISASKIHSYCLLCLTSYVISFSLFFYSWIIRRRFCQTSLHSDFKTSFSLILKNKPLHYALIFLFIAGFSLKIFLPQYWLYQFPEPDTNIPYGITEDGHPWIGATNPTLTIEEFTDYQCFQCAKMHYYLRRLVVEYPKKLRLVHRNYPMDHEVNPIVLEPFHIGSGRLALLSIAAQKQNKFWQVNDILFKEMRKKKTEIKSHEIAKQVQADPVTLTKDMYTEESIKKLEIDIRAGLSHKITGTPGYMVNGELYLGNLPETLFKHLYE